MAGATRPANARQPRGRFPDLSSGPRVEGLKGGSEIAKQLITLSTAMIGLTISFRKDIVCGGTTPCHAAPGLMAGAWLMYAICILASVATLMGICGAMTVLDRKAMKLAVKPEHEGCYDVYAPTVRVPMLVMVLSFLLGIGLTIGAAANSHEPVAAKTAVAKPG